MSDKFTYFLAVCLLIFVFIIAVLSIKDDSLTMDELAHLPAGYSYLTQKDMRLNPEHPPLIKDLAGLPLLFIKGINFPYEAKSWKEDVNGQWDFGNTFLFKSNNPAEKMIFWGRIPMLLILVLLGLFIFIWTKELFGNIAGLLALFLFSFSPSFLAHGRLVTTDVGAAFGAFIAAYYFIKFLKNSSKKNLIISGIALGIALLLKFSLILLLPFFGIIVVIWAIAKSSNIKEFFKIFSAYFLRSILIGLISLILIWVVYIYHTWNYPPERQLRDTEFILSSFPQNLSKAVIWMADKPVIRALGQYLLGLSMVFQRASGGNTGYFMGEVSAAGWKIYFPTVYLIKESLTFHILALISIFYLIYLACKYLKNGNRNYSAARRQSIPAYGRESSFGGIAAEIKKLFGNLIKYHFAELSALVFIAIYWAVSLKSNLNIGVRHLLPTLPFTILLISGVISLFLCYPRPKIKKAVLGLLILWQIYSVISVYPHFLAYFNELAGGPSQGYKYVTDSNLDWGQDLKRLNQWLDKNNINQIYIDYFGGSDTNYYLKGKNIHWQGDRNPNEFPKGSYLAVSATLLQGGRGKPVVGFTQSYGYYNWLNKYTPVAIIGYSIFVYHIE